MEQRNKHMEQWICSQSKCIWITFFCFWWQIGKQPRWSRPNRLWLRHVHRPQSDWNKKKKTGSTTRKLRNKNGMTSAWNALDCILVRWLRRSSSYDVIQCGINTHTYQKHHFTFHFGRAFGCSSVCRLLFFGDSVWKMKIKSLISWNSEAYFYVL